MEEQQQAPLASDPLVHKRQHPPQVPTATPSIIKPGRDDGPPGKKGVGGYRAALGAAYMLAMGVCGIVLVALGSTLEDLAENCGKTSTEVASVFVARGVGAIMGALSSAKLYKLMFGNSVMMCTLSMLALALIYMPFVTSVVTLHIAFFFLGLCTAITDTGCQIMTRKVHGKEAGPWLGANTVAFGISGALVPLIAYVTGSLFVQYSILACVATLVSVFLLLIPAPEKRMGMILGGGPPRPKTGTAVGGAAGITTTTNNNNNNKMTFCETYKTEIVIGCMVFWLIGGKVAITAYLTQYISDTGVMSDSNADLLIVVLWSAITVGRLAGLQDQRTLTLARLYEHSTILFMVGASFMFMVICFPNNAAVLWVCVAGYGMFNGPTVGYCYDLNNRLTNPSETGMSVVMFGLNFGASAIPYTLAGLWDLFSWPYVLIYTVFLSHILPYPLMIKARSMHEKDQR